jgi:hypothetical protein
MRRFALIFVAGGAAFWACSLNPQPYPPDSYDASADQATLADKDASGGADVGNSFGDGATPNDAAVVDSPTGGSDASDAATDAQLDAESDAARDGESDAPLD